MGVASLLAVLASTFILDAMARANRSDGEMARAAAKLACGSPTVQWTECRPRLRSLASDLEPRRNRVTGIQWPACRRAPSITPLSTG